MYGAAKSSQLSLDIQNAALPIARELSIDSTRTGATTLCTRRHMAHRALLFVLIVPDTFGVAVASLVRVTVQTPRLPHEFDTAEFALYS